MRASYFSQDSLVFESLVVCQRLWPNDINLRLGGYLPVTRAVEFLRVKLKRPVSMNLDIYY